MFGAQRPYMRLLVAPLRSIASASLMRVWV
jgi:hypothetical protein